MLLKFFYILFFLYIALTGQVMAIDYIDINVPSMRKISIAIPYFKPLSNSMFEIDIAKNASKILAGSLDFTGSFKVTGNNEFIGDAQNIIFQNWQVDKRVELLITGEVKKEYDAIEMDLRLFDIPSERLLIGKKYKGKDEQIREMIHKFCSEVIFSLTGNKGIFFSKIVFVSNGTGSKEIYECDFDGYAPKQITKINSITISPALSSDGNWLAFTSFKKGRPDIFIQSRSSNKNSEALIVDKAGTNITPSWVPGKFELTASLSFSGDPEIYLLTGNGKIIKRLTNQRGIDVSPSWAPDGTKFAFVSKRDGTPQIYIGNYLSGEFERLTYENSYNQEPSWSPNGDKIAFTARADGKSNIFVIGADGRGLTRFTYKGGDNESPSWSPDGNLIVFSSTIEGLSRLYVMNLYGKEQRRLLVLQGEQTSPHWSPMSDK